MPIKIKIGDAAKPPPQATIALKVSETLDGNILISDHEKMNIVIMPQDGRIATYPKAYAGDGIYEYQRDLMDSLFEGGVVGPDSIQGGLKFGVLEGYYNIENTKVDPLQVALLEIEKFIKKTDMDEVKAEEYDKNIEDRFTDPAPDETTELGKIKPEEDEPYRQSQGPLGNYSFVGYGYLY